MSRSEREYLLHIQHEVRYLLDRSSGLTKKRFLSDPTLQRAFVRSLEIIGEATKQIPKEFRDEHSQIDWRGMAGMRDRLIHGYFGVDYELVWDVIEVKIPELEKKLAPLL